MAFQTGQAAGPCAWPPGSGGSNVTPPCFRQPSGSVHTTAWAEIVCGREQAGRADSPGHDEQGPHLTSWCDEGAGRSMQRPR